MRVLEKLTASLILLCLLGTGVAFADEGDKRLFVNLTSDELNRAAMAIGCSSRVLKFKKIPVTIYLSVDAVRIADKNIPENKYVNGKSLKEMLSEFIAAGGRVFICPMCMENVGGIDKDELIEGIEIGGLDVMFTELYAEGTAVLNY